MIKYLHYSQIGFGKIAIKFIVFKDFYTYFLEILDHFIAISYRITQLKQKAYRIITIA